MTSMQLRYCIISTMILTNLMYLCGVHASILPLIPIFSQLTFWMIFVLFNSETLVAPFVGTYKSPHGFLDDDVWDIFGKILPPIYHIAIIYLWYKSVVLLHILQCKCKAILRCTSSWKRLVALRVEYSKLSRQQYIELIMHRRCM